MKTFNEFINEAPGKVDRFLVVVTEKATYGIVLTFDNTVQVIEKTGLSLEEVKSTWLKNKEAFVPKDKTWMASLCA